MSEGYFREVNSVNGSPSSERKRRLSGYQDYFGLRNANKWA